MNTWYVYKCEECHYTTYSKFFKRHRLGYRWMEKCEECSVKLPDGECKYTWHKIVAKISKVIDYRKEVQ